MVGETFTTLEVSGLRAVMANIHERVAGRDGRVQITRDGSQDVCVLISRAELESLERAMEILAGTTAFAAMSEEVRQLAAACCE